MLNDEQRRDRIAILEAQIAEMEAEDKSAEWFDEPIYARAVDGLRGAIAYQRRMLGEDR